MNKRWIAFVFITIEVLLFVVLMVTGSNTISFTSIGVAFGFSLVQRKNNDGLLLSLSLLFALIAEYFLTIAQENLEIGMAVFVVSQLINAIRLSAQNSPQSHIVHALIVLLLLTTGYLGCFIFVGINAPVLYWISILYFSLLLSNTIISFLNYRNNPLFAIGLILFLFCDITIGIDYIGVIFHFENNIFFQFLESIPFNLPWLFYLPSQVLIALSTKKSIMKEIN